MTTAYQESRRRWALLNQDPASDGSMQAIGPGARDASAAALAASTTTAAGAKAATTTTTKQAALRIEWVERTKSGPNQQLP